MVLKTPGDFLILILSPVGFSICSFSWKSLLSPGSNAQIRAVWCVTHALTLAHNQKEMQLQGFRAQYRGQHHSGRVPPSRRQCFFWGCASDAICGISSNWNSCFRGICREFGHKPWQAGILRGGDTWPGHSEKTGVMGIRSMLIEHISYPIFGQFSSSYFLLVRTFFL